MGHRLTLVVLSLTLTFSPLSHGLLGGVNTLGLIPPQLCKIMMISQGQPLQNFGCSALIVSEKKLQTAGHCGYHFFNQSADELYVDCVSGDNFSFLVNEETWTFSDPEGPLNPSKKITLETSHRVPHDIATIHLPEHIKLNTSPMKVLSGSSVQDFVQSADQCFLTATGFEGRLKSGDPQAKLIQQENIVFEQDGVLALLGMPQVSGRDSGGGLVCDGTLVASIVSHLSGANILTSLLPSVAASADVKTLGACPGESPSKAVLDSIPHILGFSEVRGYLKQQLESGLKACVGGVTLGRNIYQYHQNLIFIKMFNTAQEVIKQTTLLFQVSSIQGHHSPEGRPWVVLNSTKVNQGLEDKVLKAPLNPTYQPVGPALNTDEISLKLPEAQNEVSSVLLSSSDGNDYYLVSWLKEVTAANAGSAQVSPRYAVFRKGKESEAELVSQGPAFHSLLNSAEDLVEQASKEASQLRPNEQMDFIDRLSQLSN